MCDVIVICASCKKTKNDRGIWRKKKIKITFYSEDKLSHGICPDCAKQLYPDLISVRQDKYIG